MFCESYFYICIVFIKAVFTFLLYKQIYWVFFQPNELKFFDLEEAVTEWGNMMYDRNARSRKQKRMKKKHFVDNQPCIDVQIDWSRLSVTHETVWGRVVDVDLKAKDPATTGTTSHRPADVTAVEANVLFKTDFTNDTEERQEYCLKIEKTTNSSCTTEIENGVTKGVELSATLTIGDVLEVGGAFSREVSLTKMEGETIEQEMVWGAESTIVVPPGRAATAEMYVLEKRQSGDFVVLTKMQGSVLIKYVSLKDNSLLFSQSGKIRYIVNEYVKEMKGMGKAFRGIEEDKESGSVTFQTKGQCKFRFGISQVVKVIQDPKPIRSK